MAESIGGLHAEISANSAQFTTETEKAVHQARKTAQRMNQQFRHVDRGSRESTRSVADSWAGAGASISGAIATLELSGVKGASAIGTVSGALSALAISGVGPLALAVTGITALATAVTSLTSENAELSESIKQQERDLAALEKRANRVANALQAARQGRPTASVSLDSEIESTAADVKRLLAEYDKAAKALADKETMIANAVSQGSRLERGLGALVMRPILEGEASDLADQADILLNQLNTAQAKLHQLKKERDSLIEASEAQAQRRRDQARTDTGASALAAEIAHLAPGASTAEAIQRETEAREKALDGFSEYLRREFGTAEEVVDRMTRTVSEGRGVLDAEAQRSRQEHLRMFMRSVDDLRRASDEESRATDAVRSDVSRAEEDLAFELAQIHRSTTEQTVAETERRYASMITAAKAAGVSTIQLETLLAERVARIRALAGPPAAQRPTRDQQLQSDIDSDDFSRGFGAQLQRISDDTTTLGQLGAGVASDLRNGFSEIFEGAIRGADDLANRLDRLSDRLQSQLIQFGFDRLLNAGFTAVGLVETPVKKTSTPAGSAIAEKRKLARGGSFKVGGVGSVDSKLIQFHATPGELIEATPPGRTRAAGGETRVIVENPTAAPATTERRRRADGGEDVMVMFERSAARSIRQGGELDQAIREKYGLHRGTRRR